MNFPSQIFFNDINRGYRAAILKKNSLWLLPFYMVVATCFYYEKVRRTMGSAIVSNLLNYSPQLFSLFFYKFQSNAILLRYYQLEKHDHNKIFSSFSFTALFRLKSAILLKYFVVSRIFRLTLPFPCLFFTFTFIALFSKIHSCFEVFVITR